MTTFTTTILLPTLLVLMQLLSAAAANGWNLDMACQPVGEVSKVYYSYDGSYGYGDCDWDDAGAGWLADQLPLPQVDPSTTDTG